MVRLIKFIFLFIYFLFPAICFADKIQGHACYTYGDNESLVQAEHTAKMLAIRNAIEANSIFIESTSQVTDFQLTQDLLKSVSAGEVKGVNILKRLQSGRTLCYTVEGFINPTDIQSAIKEYLAGKRPDVHLQDNGWLKIIGMGVRKETREQLHKRLKISVQLKESEKEKIFMTLIIKIQFLKHAKAIQIEEQPLPEGMIISALKKEFEKVSGIKMEIEKAYVKKFASDYHFKILVTFLNENGLAIKTVGDYIEAEDKDEALPGEEDYALFCIPDGATSWKVWVAK